MEDNTIKNIAYMLTGVSLLGMTWFIWRRALKNREAILEAHAPKVAGSDVLEGGARHPQQFDEPDDDALEEMAKLLGEDDLDDEA